MNLVETAATTAAWRWSQRAVKARILQQLVGRMAGGTALEIRGDRNFGTVVLDRFRADRVIGIDKNVVAKARRRLASRASQARCRSGAANDQRSRPAGLRGGPTRVGPHHPRAMGPLTRRSWRYPYRSDHSTGSDDRAPTAPGTWSHSTKRTRVVDVPIEHGHLAAGSPLVTKHPLDEYL